MADINQFGSARLSQSADAKLCFHFEAMLTDAVDGSLSSADQAAFDLHLLGCAACTAMLAEARRGEAWMALLRQQAPEPPANLLDRILAQTSGARQGSDAGTAGAGGVALMSAGSSEIAPGPVTTSNLLPFPSRLASRINLRAVGHTLLQPRLAMTAAMAFFSIALTLNLTGVRLSELKASDLKPASLKRNIYEANAHVVRYYTNLRVVYELESRVRDLQRSSDGDLPANSSQSTPARDGAPGQRTSDPEKKGQENEAAPKRTSPGTSRREPLDENLRTYRASTGREDEPIAKPAFETLAMLSTRVELPDQGRGTV